MTTVRPIHSLPAVRPAFRSHKHHRVRDALTVAVFLASLVVPLGGYLFRTPVQPANENRPLSPPPVVKLRRWAVKSFPPVFEPYFNDRVGFRAELLALRRRVVYDLLGDSTADTVWVGRDGWLFMNCGGAKGGLPAFQPPADRHIDGWADALADRHAYLADRGITYVVFVARDKSAVYPEFLPGPHRRHPQPDPVPLIRERLRGIDLPLVDALPALLAAKPTTPGTLYFRRDSHWNDPGTFVGYQALGAELERRVPGYRAKTAAAFDPVPCVHPGIDLAMALGLPPDRATEDYPFYGETSPRLTALPTAGRTDMRPPDGLSHLTPSLSECPAAAGTRAVLLHDSFGVNMVRFVASDFRRLAAVGTYGLPVPVLEAERPRVVVQLLVDRTFRHVPPFNPPEVAGYRAGRR